MFTTRCSIYPYRCQCVNKFYLALPDFLATNARDNREEFSPNTVNNTIDKEDSLAPQDLVDNNTISALPGITIIHPTSHKMRTSSTINGLITLLFPILFLCLTYGPAEADSARAFANGHDVTGSSPTRVSSTTIYG